MGGYSAIAILLLALLSFRPAALAAALAAGRRALARPFSMLASTAGPYGGNTTMAARGRLDLIWSNSSQALIEQQGWEADHSRRTKPEGFTILLGLGIKL